MGGVLGVVGALGRRLVDLVGGWIVSHIWSMQNDIKSFYREGVNYYFTDLVYSGRYPVSFSPKILVQKEL